MRLVAFCFFLILTNNLLSQDSTYKFVKVVQIDGLSKDEIFAKSLMWCSKTFINSNDAIKVKERENGLIAGKGRFNVSYKFKKKNGSTGPGYYTTYDINWTIEIKDGKFRFSSDLYCVTAPSSQFEGSIKVINKNYPPFEPFPAFSKENIIANWKAGTETAEIELSKIVDSLTNEIQKNSNF